MKIVYSILKLSDITGTEIKGFYTLVLKFTTMTKKITILGIALLNVFTVFAQQKPTSSSQDFWNELKNHCGNTYEGIILAGGKEGDGFTRKKLIMHVKSCNDTEILIPFNVGENRSRTWILTKNKEGAIQLKHDHRKEDGSNDAVTMYGGTTTNLGSKNLQVFPADEETRNNIAYAAGNIWWITIDDKTFTYNLRRIGTPRFFSVSFDLTKKLETPKTSWGW